MTSITTSLPTRKIAAFIISGGTASGKTTILNSLVQKLPLKSKAIVVLHQHAKSFGLETTKLVNKINKDGTSTIFSIEQVFDFGSGCICCSPDGDLTRLLSNISATNNSDNITHIFIETTGVADVRSFARLFSVEETITSYFELKGIVTVVNNNTIKTILTAKNDLQKRQQCREFDQYQQANLLIENNFYENDFKQDVMETSINKTKEVWHELEHINKHAKIVTKAKLDAINTEWHDIYALIEVELRNASRVKLNKDDDCSACTVASGESDAFQKLKSVVRMKGHDRTFQSVCLVEKGCVYLSKILPWLEQMLLSSDNPVFRIKGYFAVGAEEDLTNSQNINQYQVEQNYVGNYYCEGSFITGLKIFPINQHMDVENNNAKTLISTNDNAANNIEKTATNFDNFLYAEDSSKQDTCGTKIFIFGKNLNEGDISTQFCTKMVPNDFIPICDINTDFPAFVSDYFKLSTDEEKKFFFKHGKDEENWRAAYRVSMGSKKDDVCIFFVRGKFYAIQASCPHLGGDLDKGDIEDFARVGGDGSNDQKASNDPWPMVSCPQHLFSFDLRSGKGLTSKYNCNTYRLKLVGSTIYLYLKK